MQREKKRETYPIVKLIHPRWFWKECRFCNKEFKKEDGFEILDFKACRASNEYPLFTSYCCNKCANNIEQVKDKIEKSSLKYKLNRIRHQSQ
ncbi:hypothetical protein [Clostridium sp. YIM B02551]|uniref:hypothetical protein n=1 Tax=Clostridium sp. YIM B02551 TaxID=2910679 RepID=UPI001EEB559F|nr:hypothetical protein [Clostridium sp. YIM B02551]